MVLARDADGDADREQDAEVREDGLPGGGDRRQVEQVRLPEPQQQARDGQHGDRQHQRAAELLQAGEQAAHGDPPVTASARSARTAAASAASSARPASARHSASVRRRTASLTRRNGARRGGQLVRRRGRRAAAPPPARTRGRRRPRRAPAARAAAQTESRSGCSTAGCRASSPCDSSGCVRSIASTYCVRSLVPIERKSACAASRAGVHGGGGRLDHDADRDVRIAARARRDLAHQRAHRLDLGGLVHHRQQDPAAAGGPHATGWPRAACAGAPGRHRLGADAAQPERGIVLARHRQERDRLVAAGVERADARPGGPPSRPRSPGIARAAPSRSGGSLRSRNRNSVRSRPQPSAPDATAAAASAARADVGQHLDALAVRGAAVERRRRLGIARARARGLAMRARSPRAPPARARPRPVRVPHRRRPSSPRARRAATRRRRRAWAGRAPPARIATCEVGRPAHRADAGDPRRDRAR